MKQTSYTTFIKKEHFPELVHCDAALVDEFYMSNGKPVVMMPKKLCLEYAKELLKSGKATPGIVRIRGQGREAYDRAGFLGMRSQCCIGLDVATTKDIATAYPGESRATVLERAYWQNKIYHHLADIAVDAFERIISNSDNYEEIIKEAKHDFAVNIDGEGIVLEDFYPNV